MLSLADLRTPLTDADGLALVLGIMTSLGFETTAWQDGSIQKTIVTAQSLCVADLSELSRQIADFGFNDFATGPALTAFSWSRYRNLRLGAVRTKGSMRLRSVSSIPYTILVGQLLVTTPDGIQYRNTTGGTVLAGTTLSPSSLVLEWEARLAGAAGNIPRNTALVLVTPLSGVTVTNAEATPWYSTVGKDEEFDSALRLRNSTKWTRLSAELVGDAYRNIALDNGAAKVAIADQNPRGPGTIDVYVAGQSGPLGTPELAALQAVFAARCFNTDASYPAAADSSVAVLAPATQNFDLTATLYYDPNVDAAVIVAATEQALNDLLALTPLGGFSFTPLENVITLGDLYEALENVEGMRTVGIALPAANFAVTPYAQVVRGTWSFTPVAVS